MNAANNGRSSSGESGRYYSTSESGKSPQQLGQNSRSNYQRHNNHKNGYNQQASRYIEDNSPRIHVANINEFITRRDLRDVFEKFGPLTDIWIPDKGPFYAFVSFKNNSDCMDAILKLKNYVLKGCHIKVTRALKKVNNFPSNRPYCSICKSVGHYSDQCRSSDRRSGQNIHSRSDHSRMRSRSGSNERSPSRSPSQKRRYDIDNKNKENTSHRSRSSSSSRSLVKNKKRTFNFREDSPQHYQYSSPSNNRKSLHSFGAENSFEKKRDLYKKNYRQDFKQGSCHDSCSQDSYPPPPPPSKYRDSNKEYTNSGSYRRSKIRKSTGEENVQTMISRPSSPVKRNQSLSSHGRNSYSNNEIDTHMDDKSLQESNKIYYDRTLQVFGPKLFSRSIQTEPVKFADEIYPNKTETTIDIVSDDSYFTSAKPRQAMKAKHSKLPLKKSER